MERELPKPDRTHLSVMAALVLLSYALTRLVVLPSVATDFVLFGLLVRFEFNTQTVMLTLMALLLLGGVTTRHFVAILLIGVLSGTYSSIFNAAPILVVWENREWRSWFRRKPASAAN